jgi:choline monooxygenase
MTPLGGPLARQPLDERSARSQLSVTTYFSDELFKRELELIFQHGPRYLGHELAVPEVGDYHALPQEGEGRALVRTPTGWNCSAMCAATARR